MVLENGKKYIVIKQAVYKCHNYYVSARLTDDEEDILEEYVIFEEVDYNGKKAVLEVKDADLYKLVAKYVGSYIAAMNGVDVIAFTAGVGENDATTRKLVCEQYLGYLGVKIDDERNNVRGQERLISSDDSSVKVYLIPTNEELKIAMDTQMLIENR